MTKESKRGIIDNIPNKKLESLLNLFGSVDKLAEKLGVTRQGLYRSLTKRGLKKRPLFILPDRDTHKNNRFGKRGPYKKKKKDDE